MTKIYGYIRIDPKESNPEEAIEDQKKKLRANYVGFEFHKFIYDIHSGENFDRPGWKELKNIIKPGEKVIITSLEILSSSTLPTTIKEIQELQSKKIEVNILEFENNLWSEILTKLYLYSERVRLRRQMESIASIAKNEQLRKVKYRGRKSIINAIFLENLKDLINQQITSPTELGRKLGISRSTIYKALQLLNPEELESTKNEPIV